MAHSVRTGVWITSVRTGVWIPAPAERQAGLAAICDLTTEETEIGTPRASWLARQAEPLSSRFK